MNPNPLLAATQLEDVTAVTSVFAVMAAVFLVLFVVSTVASVVVCLLLNIALNRIPPEHRRIEPALVWLLLIPCFGLYWNFPVFLRVPDSFRSAYEAQGRGAEVGDGGRVLGLAYAISAVLCVVPLVNYLAAPAAFVLLIVCLIRFHDLQKRIDRPAVW